MHVQNADICNGYMKLETEMSFDKIEYNILWNKFRKWYL